MKFALRLGQIGRVGGSRRLFPVVLCCLAAAALTFSIAQVAASGKRKSKPAATAKTAQPQKGRRAAVKPAPTLSRPERQTEWTPFRAELPAWLNELYAPAGEGSAVWQRQKGKRADQPDKAFEYFMQKRLPEGETELPFERYVEAMEAMEQMPLHSTADNRWVQSRSELAGLAPDQQRLGTWTWLGPGNIGGRTRAIVFHPQNPDIIYAAGVSGGVWKSTNAGAMWTPISDRIANIPISALALEPGNPNVIYAGTGEGFVIGSQNGVNITGAHRGLGIYKSTDAGATWARLEPTATPDFYYVNDIVISTNGPQRVYAATETGVWRSLDGGANWTRVHNPNTTGGCLDLAIRTDQMTDTVFAACGTRAQSRIFRNTDAGGGGAWTEVLADTGAGRTVLAIAPSNQNVIYALSTAFTGTFANSLHAVHRSINGGEAGSWTARVRNTDPNKLNRAILSDMGAAMASDCKLGGADSVFGQGFYDLAMAVDPGDENRVWVGGIDLARSDDGGANWGIAGFAYAYVSSSLVYGQPNQVHPDQHFITFHPQYNGTTNQQMFVGNDGGIWKTENARAAVGTGPTGACNPANSAVRFAPLNNNYGVTQFYHGAVAPDGKSYFGGTQDNGTVRGTDDGGPNKWQSILLADGGYAAIDFRNPSILYASTQGAGFRRSTDNGATFSSATLGLGFNARLFITPLAMDPSDSLRLYTGGEPVWRTDNGMAAWTLLGSIRGVTLTTGTMSAVAVAPADANYVMWGMTDGSIVRTTRALSLGPTNQLSPTVERFARPRVGAFVSWVAYDPNDKNIAYATYSTFGGSHIYRSTNSGESWTAIDGTGGTGFPDIPAHTIVVDPSNSARLYVGTDLGVFVSTDTGATWAVENTGFANVVTESLTINVTGGVTSLYAFTHGRGAYKVTANMAGCSYLLARSGSAVGVSGGDLTVDVNVAPGGCAWKAESNASWIAVQPGAGGSANGTVGMKVEANRGFGTRVGTVTIAGRSFTVTQEGGADLDSPALRVTAPATLSVNTVEGNINVAGTATDNLRVASVSWRSNRGLSGTATGTTNWAITGLPLITGRNEITITAADDARNVSNAVVLVVNSMPSSVLVTIAGNGVSGLAGDGGPALLANVGNMARLATDAGGNVYIAEFATQRVRRVTPAGVITTIAGTGVSGFAGDGGPANQARLNLPVGVAVDAAGNVFISDYGNQRIRRVAAGTGVITTVAGTGTGGFSGDGGPATSAQINFPEAIAVDKAGNLFIPDSVNHRIRKVDAATGVITTVAGTGTAGFSGDNGPANAAQLLNPLAVVVDASDNLFIADSGNTRIRRVAASDGTIRTIAGSAAGFAGDDGPANAARLSTSLIALTLDAAGNLFIADLGNQRIRRIAAATQVITTVVGSGVAGFTPDGAGAVGARIGSSSGLAIDPAGLLIFGDRTNNRVRKVLPGVPGDTAAPVVTITSPTITGGTFTATSAALELRGTATDNGTVVSVRWSNDRGGSGEANGTTNWTVSGIGLQSGVNNLTVTAWDVSGNAASTQVAVSYTPAQIVTTIAGTGVIANTGDNGPGTAATLFQPRGVAVDSKGNILVADTQNRRVRRIAPNGVITAFAGTGFIGSGGDGGPAVDATLNFPNVVIVDKADNVYISDQLTNRIRKVTPDGKISTIAGTGEGFGGFAGDGGPATQAQLNGQVGLAVDNDGNLFIADRLSHRIRRIDGRTGIITTVAGNGQVGSGGDGGPATQAELNQPAGVAVDGAGNLYITDLGNFRIRRVSAADGRMSTLAGTGAAGFSGDGGPATSALINISYPATINTDAAGDVYFADRANHRIRKITLSTGVITTVAGTGVATFNGDGTAPAGTALSFPSSVAFDAMGNLIIADSGNNRVRRVRTAAGVGALANVSAASFTPATGLAAEAIAAVFGTNMATATVAATEVPLPVTLGGTTVRVRDSLSIERLAPLFFVSPTQINYLVPSGTAPGLATVTITSGSGEISTGTVSIGTVAPGLFSANSTGTGLAAAVVFRRTAAGVDSFEPVVRFDSATNRFVAVPIDLGAESDQVFLIPYGSGIRGNSGLANVRATIGGVNAPVIYAGGAPGLLGADQLNLRLDRSLIGRGEVDVIVIADSRMSNAVRVAFK
jgi:uncharacterized protein (TIGR03437 family)